MERIKSFDAYFSNEKPKDEVSEGLSNKVADLKKKAQEKATTQKQAPVKPTAKLTTQAQPQGKKPSLFKKKPLLKKTNESAIIVDADYKVKTVIEIPKSIIDSYCKRVKSETGKAATSIFSREELAEEIVKYLVKSNLNAETIPTSIAVGDTEGESSTPTQTEEVKKSQDEPVDPFADETEEIELDMDDEEELPMKKGSSAMDFEGKEVEVGEKDSLELDPKQPKNY